MGKVYVMCGEAQRGTDELFFKGFIDGDQSSETIKQVLLTNFSGLYSEEGLEEYIEEWLDKEDDVVSFSDDMGGYVYVGYTKEEVVNVWMKYFD